MTDSHQEGVPANVKDNNTGTYYGHWLRLWDSFAGGDWYYEATVTFAELVPFINKAEIYHWGYVSWYGTDVNWAVDLYYGGSWSTVMSGSFTYDTQEFRTNSSTTGWANVSKVRLRAATSWHAGGDLGNVYMCHRTCELRAYGPGEGDLGSNKLVYSIGNKGIETVDYAIAIKNYNY